MIVSCGKVDELWIEGYKTDCRLGVNVVVSIKCRMVSIMNFQMGVTMIVCEDLVKC